MRHESFLSCNRHIYPTAYSSLDFVLASKLVRPVRPHMCFVLLGSRLCLDLLSDSTSRWILLFSVNNSGIKLILLDGRHRRWCPALRFPHSGHDFRDTFSLLGSDFDGDEIHHGCHAKVNTCDSEQEGLREMVRPVQFQPSERDCSEMLRTPFGDFDHVNLSTLRML